MKSTLFGMVGASWSIAVRKCSYHRLLHTHTDTPAYTHTNTHTQGENNPYHLTGVSFTGVYMQIMMDRFKQMDIDGPGHW